MQENFETREDGRKVWVAPELRRLRAGAAESGGPQNIPDGGDPEVSARS